MTPKNSGLAYKLSDEEFKKIILESSSCIEAMKKLGFTCCAGNARLTVKRRIKELNIDITHWEDNTKNAHKATRYSNEEYYKKDAQRSGNGLRKRLIKDNLLEYKCALCGNTGEWNGQVLVLQVDHINGDHSNNRLENLRFLCPNCHSQTDTFAGKNVKVK